MDTTASSGAAPALATASGDRCEEAQPRHLVGTAAEDWAVWRWAAVRGAGFAASLPLQLATPDSATLADAIPSLDARDPAPAAEWTALRDALARESTAISRACCALAADDRFREALLWQNRGAVDTCLDTLLRHSVGAPRTSRHRQQQEMIASYLQRYCLKNETIGFFGPVGWAMISRKGPALAAQPGPRLLSQRTVYFESWAIDALAAALSRDGRLDPWLAPRLAHQLHLAGDKLFGVDRSPIDLSPADAALLSLCDRERSVVQIARDLSRDGRFDDADTAQVLDRIRSLRDRGWIVLSAEPPMDVHAERWLERLLRGVGDPLVREPALRALADLLDARDRVADASGRPPALEQAIDGLNATFTRLTGAAPTRLAGRTYAGRTLVYEDCRRDITIEVGPELLDAIAQPLSLLLTSARWFTFDVARRADALCTALHAEMAAEIGAADVDFAPFFERVRPVVFGPEPMRGEEVLHQRWAEILDIPPDRNDVSYRSAELAARVAESFAAPHAGWPLARYHSPDVMICAHSLDEVRRGNYLLVLGELHASSNTLGWPCFLGQHPSEPELRQAAMLDVPELRVEPILPKRFWPGQTARLLPSLFAPTDFRLELSGDAVDCPRSQILSAGAIVVTRGANGLVIRTRDGGLELPFLSVVAQILTWRVMNRFSLRPPADHRPRITIDRLVIARESWRLASESIAFAAMKDEAQRFVAARRWARERGLPRQVFVKTPIEHKPFYVDFDSLTYVNILAKSIRRSRAAKSGPAPVTLTEMLPRPEHTWLTDAEGTRYGSELRLVMVDRRSSGGWSGAA